MAHAPAPPFPPMLVHSRGNIAGVLQARREALGMTCEDLDALAGFSERYANKLEAGDTPCGKRGFYIEPGRDRVACSFMAEIWLQSLDAALVVMSPAQAREIGAVPAPVRPPKVRRGPPTKARAALERGAPDMKSGAARPVGNALAPSW